jgi:hypothetical protein
MDCFIPSGGIHTPLQINSPMLVKYRWEHEAIFHDEDGSLTDSGIKHTMLVPTSPILPAGCQAEPRVANFPASLCFNTKFR